MKTTIAGTNSAEHAFLFSWPFSRWAMFVRWRVMSSTMLAQKIIAREMDGPARAKARAKFIGSRIGRN